MNSGLFSANYACACMTAVVENSLINPFRFPKRKKERISKKRYLSVKIRFRLWRSISNPDFPIERNLSKLQFRKLLSSGSNFTPKWLKDLCVSLQQERWWYWARQHFRRVLEKKRWRQYRFLKTRSKQAYLQANHTIMLPRTTLLFQYSGILS